MKYKNGILFMDEFDKISENKNVRSALLHIIDFSQNSSFRDNYLQGINIDLSKLWFIFSMNNIPSNKALRDRINVIEVPEYTTDDKINIVSDFIIPKALKSINQPINSIKMSKQVITHIVSLCTDSGIRSLEYQIFNLVNKIDFLIANQNRTGKIKDINISFNITKKLKYPLTIDINMFQSLV
jgi:ATP-dependent Lon protease